jgi:hypothetical protein
MAATDVIRLVSGDERPVIILTLTDDTTGSPIDLSAPTTSVSVKFRKAGTTTLLSTINCTKVDSGAGGKIQFSFVGGVLDTVTPGMYEGEVVILFNTETQTVFETLRFTVRDNF